MDLKLKEEQVDVIAERAFFKDNLLKTLYQLFYCNHN